MIDFVQVQFTGKIKCQLALCLIADGVAWLWIDAFAMIEY